MRSLLFSSKKKKLPIGVLGFILYVAGIAAFCSPLLWARRTYVSENALIPGGAHVRFSNNELQRAVHIARGWSEHVSTKRKDRDDVTWVMKKLEELGLDAYRHDYSYTEIVNHTRVNHRGTNVYSIVRAHKSSGQESIVLSSTFNRPSDVKIGPHAVTGLSMSMSILHYLSQQKWLAKDMILVLTDEEKGAERGLKSWLEDYLGIPRDSTIYNATNLPARSGAIQMALHIEIKPSDWTRGLSLSIAGPNGQLPNLDLINTLARICNYRGIYDDEVDLNDIPKPLVKPFTEWKGQFLHHAMELLPTEYYNLLLKAPPQLYNLFAFMVNQAVGVPTGMHGVYSKGRYHIDAMTVSNRMPADERGVQRQSMAIYGQILEGTLRSMNNLLEKLHQSFYFYLLPSSSLYLAIGDYMIPLGLVLGVYMLQLYLNLITMPHTVDAAYSLCVVALFEILGFTVYSLPTVIRSISLQYGLFLNSEEVTLYWVSISTLLTLVTFFTLHIVTSLFPTADVTPLKTFAPLILSTFLSVNSLSNYSFCFFCALVYVPVFGLIRRPPHVISTLLQSSLLLAVSPVAVVYGVGRVLDMEPLEVMGEIMRQHEEYGNLAFTFLTIGLLPSVLSFLKFVTHAEKK
ncbi:hypothetical protein PROFUN_11379 [Planoprotostelium fungivorum]|uniref:Uncharacterized protein n=1 Tax=Planoprotostelium fungivorum TaxID=1890364 RepID=A0A2P6N300_9EUKA|nr:hypothetical protein PROFUN_11379 [Planoprotostelium fungivorum]